MELSNPGSELSSVDNTGPAEDGSATKAPQLSLGDRLFAKPSESVSGPATTGSLGDRLFPRQTAQQEAYDPSVIHDIGDYSHPLGDKFRQTSGYGSRPDPITGHAANHGGLDFAAPAGTPIKAAAGGRVIKVGDANNGYGQSVEIQHADGTVTRYAHASKTFAQIGQDVQAGDVIAHVGSTGRSTGNHLHFEVLKDGKSVNPSGQFGSKAAPAEQAPEAPLSDITKARPWGEIASSAEYWKLSPVDRTAAKELYFNHWIAPHAGEDADGLFEQFMARKDKEPGIIDKIGQYWDGIQKDRAAKAATEAAAPTLGQKLQTVGGEQPLDQAPAGNPAEVSFPRRVLNMDARARAEWAAEQARQANPAQGAIRMPGSVMDGTVPTRGDLPSTSKAPVDQKFHDAVAAQWDAATVYKRADMQRQPGLVGQIARDRAGAMGQLDQKTAGLPDGAAINKIDPRAEVKARTKGTDPISGDATGANLAEDAVAAGSQIFNAFTGMAGNAWGSDDPKQMTKEHEGSLATKWVKAARQDATDNSNMVGANDTYVNYMGVKIKRSDIRNFPQNLAFSLGSMGVALASAYGHAGAAAWAAAPAGPAASMIAGTVGGVVGAAGASYAAGYRMSTNQFLWDLREGFDKESQAQRGKPLSDDEWLTIAEAPEMRAAAKEFGMKMKGSGKLMDIVDTYGNHEAGWEAAGNVFTMGAAKYIFKAAAKEGLLSVKGAAKIIGAEAVDQVVEVGGEATTNIGQKGAEWDAGISDESHRPSFTNISDWKKSIGEVAGPTIMTTALMGGGAAIAGKISGRNKDAPAPKERKEPGYDNTVHDHTGDGHNGDEAPAGQPLAIGHTVEDSAPGITTRYTEDGTDTAAGPKEPPSGPSDGSGGAPATSDQDVFDFVDRREEYLTNKRDGITSETTGDGEIIQHHQPGNGLSKAESEELAVIHKDGHDINALRAFYGMNALPPKEKEDDRTAATAREDGLAPGQKPPGEPDVPTKGAAAPVTDAGDAPVGASTQRLGQFDSYAAAKDYISNQRRNSGSSLPAALPIEHEDGSFGVVSKGQPGWDKAVEQKPKTEKAMKEKVETPAVIVPPAPPVAPKVDKVDEAHQQPTSHHPTVILNALVDGMLGGAQRIKDPVTRTAMVKAGMVTDKDLTPKGYDFKHKLMGNREQRIEAIPQDEIPALVDKELGLIPVPKPKKTEKSVKKAKEAANGTQAPEAVQTETQGSEAPATGITVSPENPEWDRFTYKGVIVDFEAGDGSASVFDISSKNKRSGEAREALLKLKHEYSKLHAEGVMEDSPEANSFWQKMLDEGVVATATRTDNIKLIKAEKKFSIGAAEDKKPNHLQSAMGYLERRGELVQERKTATEARKAEIDKLVAWFDRKVAELQAATEEAAGDSRYAQAKALVFKNNKPSASLLKTHFKLSAEEAESYLQRMEHEGVLGQKAEDGSRQVLERYPHLPYPMTEMLTDLDVHYDLVDSMTDDQIKAVAKALKVGKRGEPISLKRRALRAMNDEVVLDAVNELEDNDEFPHEPSENRFDPAEDWGTTVANFVAPKHKIIASKLAGPIIPLDAAKEKLAEWKAAAKKAGNDEDHSHEIIISLFDATGSISQPWVDAGYDVRQYDLELGDDLLEHFPMYDLIQINEQVAAGTKVVVGVIGQPPCTTFSSSGARWWATRHDKHDRDMVTKMFGPGAARYFSKPKEYTKALATLVDMVIGEVNPKFFMLENPVGRIATEMGLPKPTLSFDPCVYGDPYTKETNLWGTFNTDLPTANVFPTLGSLMHKKWSTAEKRGGERSATPEGFAYSFFMANKTEGKPVIQAAPLPVPKLTGRAPKQSDDQGTIDIGGQKALPKTYLMVPFTSKDFAKKAGAKWDAENKLWYAEPIDSGMTEGKLAINLHKFVPQDPTGEERFNFFSDKDTARVVALNKSQRTGDEQIVKAATHSDGVSGWKVVGAPKTEKAIKQSRGTVTTFMSGMSHKGDLMTVLQAGKPVGTEINELTEPTLNLAAKTLGENGGMMFVDSGAYSVFKANIIEKDTKKRHGEPFNLEQFGYPAGFNSMFLDFPEILKRYEDLVSKAQKAAEDSGDASFDDSSRYQIYLVMPDMVGDQQTSIAMAAQYGDHIRGWSGMHSVKPIVPIQRGEISLAEAYDALVKILGDDFIVGIPSSEEAVTNAELEEFIKARGDKIARIHILGAASASRLNPKLDIIRASTKNQIEITADATTLRTHMWGGTPRAVALRKALEHAGTREIDAPAPKTEKAAKAKKGAAVDSGLFAPMTDVDVANRLRALPAGDTEFRNQVHYLVSPTELAADVAQFAANAAATQAEFEADLAAQTGGAMKAAMANLAKWGAVPTRVERILAKLRSVGGMQARLAGSMLDALRTLWDNGQFAEPQRRLIAYAGNTASRKRDFKPTYGITNAQALRNFGGLSDHNSIGPERGLALMAALRSLEPHAIKVTPVKPDPVAIVRPLATPAGKPKNEREKADERRQTVILLPDGTKVAAEWDVVEADSIQASMKEGVSQPRDRRRLASDAQVIDIANDPDFERLSDTSKTMDYGAPTISADGLIVGGNGRFEGISIAYAAGKATNYRLGLINAAHRLGLSHDQHKGKKAPILVRRITEEADTRKLAIQSNQSAGLEPTDMERAALDAERMTALDRINISDTGDIPVTTANIDAIRESLGDYTSNEVAAMMTSEGGISINGIRRVRNAILFQAYGKSDSLARMIESPDTDLKNVGTALLKAGGQLAKVAQAIKTGTVPAEYSISADLNGAIETLSQLRDQGTSLNDYLAQVTMFSDPLSDAAKTILQFLDDNTRSARAITEFLTKYAAAVLSADPSKGGLFGEVVLPNKEETLHNVGKQFTEARAIAKAQQSIFDQPEQPAAEAGTEDRQQSDSEAGFDGSDGSDQAKAVGKPKKAPKAAPKVVPKAPPRKTKAQEQEERLFNIMGARVGDTITFDKDIDYITGGKPVVILRVADNSIYVEDPIKGGRTSVKLGLIAAKAMTSQLEWTIEPAGGKVESPRAGYGTQTDTPEFKGWFKKSAVVDYDGNPQRMYHATYRGGFDAFDRNKSTDWRRQSMDTIGHWFSDNPSEDGGAGMYASGEGASIYPVYLSIQRPKVYTTFYDALRDMHEAEGRDFEKQNPKGVGSPEGLRAKLKAQGYDGIAFQKTDNAELSQEVKDWSDSLREARLDEARAPKDQREPYTMKRERIENTLKQKKAELAATNGSTEFDKQYVWIAFDDTQIKSATGNNGDFSRAEGSIVKAPQAAYGDEPYYSALARGIEGISTKAAPASGWKDAIKGLVNKGTVKADEVEWTGVNDWLDMQSGKVSKEQLAAYLAGHGVKVVEEELLGAVDRFSSKTNDEIAATYLEVFGDDIVSDMGPDWDRAEAIAHLSNPELEWDGDTRYKTWVVPGGTHYRELLLTLPAFSANNGKSRQLTMDQAFKEMQLQNPVEVRNGADGQFVKNLLAPWQLNDNKDEIESGVYTLHKFMHFDTDGRYHTDHWGTPNILAHIRMNDRTDADGKRVLFIEELQSDWGQAGRKHGFVDQADVKRLAELNAKDIELSASIRAMRDEMKSLPDTEMERFVSLQDKIDAANAEIDTMREESNPLYARTDLRKDRVPLAPFVNTTEGWINLALKRIVTMAVHGGYDKVAFINGEQSASRYDLSQHVDELTLLHGEDGIGYSLIGTKAGDRVVFKTIGDTSELDAQIGKDATERLLAAPVKDSRGMLSQSISGDDLKVGGKGMIAFYDNIVPKTAGKLISKLGGGKMETVGITGVLSNDPEKVDLPWAERIETIGQVGFTITDAMREKAAGGLALFSPKEGYTDPYATITVRPGTTGDQKDTGRAAIAGLSTGPGIPVGGRQANTLGRVGTARGQATVLGRRIIDGFTAAGGNQLTGQVVSSSADLASLAQVYRDPRFETFRVVYVAGKVIIGEAGYTSRLPGSVFLPNDLPTRVQADKARFGADGYYIMHNHPTGRAAASESDVTATTNMAGKVSGFLGHVIIDHNEYATIDASGKTATIPAPELNGTDFTGRPGVPNKLLGTEIAGPQSLARLAKALQMPAGHATLVLTDSTSAVQLLVDVPMGALTDTSRQGLLKGKALLRRMARDSGSGGHRFIVLPAGQTAANFSDWVTEGVVADVVSADGQNLRHNLPGSQVAPDFMNDRKTAHQVAAPRAKKEKAAPVRLEGDAYRVGKRRPGNFNAEEQAAYDAFMATRTDAAAIQQRLVTLADTPWAKQAIEGIFVRQAMKELMKGGTPAYQSHLDSPQVKNMRKTLVERGESGFWYLLEIKSGIMGEPSKPLHAVNSSFINCDPTVGCATFCYAMEGHYRYAGSIVKSEMITLAVELDAARAAERVAAEYMNTPEFHNNKALRLFDKGDGNDAWLPFIRALNKNNIRTQIFSKVPEFLRKVPDFNLRLLSIDSGNIATADANLDLKVALIYTSPAQLGDAARLAARDQIAVVLPVKESGKQMARPLIDELKKAVPSIKPVLCPIDAGVKVIGNNIDKAPRYSTEEVKANPKLKEEKGRWNCTSCDNLRNGIGCYYGAPTHAVLKSREVQPAEVSTEDALIQKLKEMFNERDARTNQALASAGRGRPGYDQGLVQQVESLLGELLSRNDSSAEGGLHIGLGQGTDAPGNGDAGGVREQRIPVGSIGRKTPKSAPGSDEGSGTQVSAPQAPYGNTPREDRAAIQQEFGVAKFNKFNWLHNTVGTQYHKAQISPEFKRVFDLANSMESVGSLISVRTAELAPNVLPRALNLVGATKQIFMGRNAARDLPRAVDAILQGTTAGRNVLEGVVYTTAQLRSEFGMNDKGIALYHQMRAAINTALFEVAAAEVYALASNYVPRAMREGLRDMFIDEPRRGVNRLIQGLNTSIASMQARSDQARALGHDERVISIDAMIADYQDTLEKVDKIIDFASQLAAAGYAPLMRFGKYAVTVQERDPMTGELVRDADGASTPLFFGRYDTQAEAKDAYFNQGARYAGMSDSVSITTGVVNDDEHQMYAGATPEVIGLFANMVGGKTVEQMAYKKAVSDQSALKRRISRKNVAGYSREYDRVLSNFVMSSGRWAANRYYMNDLRKSVVNIKDKSVQKEAQKLFNYVTNQKKDSSQDLAAATSSIAFMWYLGGPTNVASALMNLFQVATLLPQHLVKFTNPARAAWEIAKAYPMAVGLKEIPADLRLALRKASQEGKVDAQEVHHLYNIGIQGIQAYVTDKVGRVPLIGPLTSKGLQAARYRLQAAGVLWGAMFGVAETINRRVSFIAAWNIARREGIANPFAFAIDTVDATQGVYTKSARPNLGRNAYGRMLETFKMVPTMWVEILIRNIKQGGKPGYYAAAVQLATLILMAGAAGFPFEDDILDIVDSVGQHFNFNTNSKKARDDWARETLGDLCGPLMLNGVSSMLPFDIGPRLGMANLIPGTGLFKKSNEGNRAREVSELAGVGGSLGVQAIDAWDAFNSGQGAKALLGVAPAAVKNLAAGIEMAVDGVARDPRGQFKAETTVLDGVLKGMGFNPHDLAVAGRARFNEGQSLSMVRIITKQVSDMYAEGIARDDEKLMDRAQALQDEWNAKNPDWEVFAIKKGIGKKAAKYNQSPEDRMLRGAPKQIRGKINEDLGLDSVR